MMNYCILHIFQLVFIKPPTVLKILRRVKRKRHLFEDNTIVDGWEAIKYHNKFSIIQFETHGCNSQLLGRIFQLHTTD